MNILYPVYKEKLLTAQANWLTDSLKVALYDVLAVYDPAHTVLGDLAGTQIAPGDDPLFNKVIANGFAGSFPTQYDALIDPLDVAVAVIYRVGDNGLIAFMDDVNGFTFRPEGDNYTLTPGGPGGTFFAL